ncbi:MAG: hypothetical protein ACRDRH_14805 [Pseudonocardia sp.]
MSTLDLVASLIVLTVGLLLIVRVLQLRPRRIVPPVVAEPPRRTVADLVRMRAEQVVAATEEERSVTPRDVVDHPEPAAVGTAAVPGAGSGQPVRFRVRCRDGGAVAGAVVTVRDDRSRTVAAATADRDGRGDLHAPRHAGYVLIVTARGHQPSAVALTIEDAPIDVEVLLARSAGGVRHGSQLGRAGA